MNILVIGFDSNLEECRAKFGETHQYTLAKNHQEAKLFFDTVELTFDFIIDEDESLIEFYRDHLKAIVFLNTSFTTLAHLTSKVKPPISRAIFGFCGMPTFLNREVLEVSIQSPSTFDELQMICKKLNTEFVLVDDRVGLVTPRVIGMIINEAYYAVQEGTATREDIDIAMKLGTNYPFGPFEWCKKIGVKNVYRLLHSVYEGTKDERYKICSLLMEECSNPPIQL